MGGLSHKLNKAVIQNTEFPCSSITADTSMSNQQATERQ